MSFYISLPKINDAIDAYQNAFEVFETEVENAHNAVMALSDDGWSGSAQTSFYEKFYMWIQSAWKIYEKLAFMGTCLGQAAFQAEVLKAQGELLAFALCPNESFFTTSEGVGYIGYDKSKKMGITVTSLALDVALASMKGKLQAANALVDSMAYQSFSAGSSLSHLCKEADTQRDNISQFSSEHQAFYSNIDIFEEEVSGQMECVAGEDFNYEEALDIWQWTDSTGLALDVTTIAVNTAFQIPKNITQSGKYVMFSGYKAGQGYTSRYLTENLNSGLYPKASRAFKLNRTLKVAGWVMVGVSAVYAGYTEYNRNPYIPEDRKALNTTVAVATDVGITLGAAKVGGLVGAKAGAALGTLIPIPVVGTVVGAVAGAVLGAAIGVGVNLLVGTKFFDGGTKSVKDKIADGISGAWNWITGKGSGTVEPEGSTVTGALVGTVALA